MKFMIQFLTQYRIKLCFAVIALGLLPLCFGGAHHTTWYFGAAALLALAALSSIRRDRSADSPEEILRLSSQELLALWALLICTALLTIYHAAVPFEHPILGKIYPARTFEPLLGLLSGCCLFLTPLFIYFSSDRRFALRAIQWSGFGIAMIALGHWFSDDGTLFGFFEPQYIFESNRARWPFVNPNHLGAFLLAPTILNFNVLLSWLFPLLTGVDTKPKARSKQLKNAPLYSIIGLIFCASALIGSQSRSAWGAGTFGLMAVFAHHLIATGLRKWERVAIVGIGFVLTGALWWSVSLSDQFNDLIANRLDFAAVNSFDDVRFKYFSDSLKLLTNHPFVGVGPGGFARDIETVARPELASLNPIYLHNEVLQYFIEFGLIGGLTLISILAVIFKGLRYPINVCAFAMLLFCMFDFPFRLAAIICQLGFIFALNKMRGNNLGSP